MPGKKWILPFNLLTNRTSPKSANDDVYHLGDFGDVRFVSKLNGRIHFLPGNHDSEDDVFQMAKHCEILNPNSRIVVEGVVLTLLHEPKDALGSDSFYLFGHIHALQMVKRNGLNVGVDCHNFTPLSANTVLALRKDITGFYENQVFVEKLGVQT